MMRCRLRTNPQLASRLVSISTHALTLRSHAHSDRVTAAHCGCTRVRGPGSGGGGAAPRGTRCLEAASRAPSERASRASVRCCRCSTACVCPYRRPCHPSPTRHDCRRDPPPRQHEHAAAGGRAAGAGRWHGALRDHLHLRRRAVDGGVGRLLHQQRHRGRLGRALRPPGRLPGGAAHQLPPAHVQGGPVRLRVHRHHHRE